MKILGGKFKGKSIKVPDERITRPSSVMLRRKVFDFRQNLEAYTFIDACAGSGLVGLEALSRGAEKVIFVEKNHHAFRILEENVASLEFDKNRYELHHLELKIWLQRELKKYQDNEHVILFLDPPYEQVAIYSMVCKELKAQGFFGECWIETDNLEKIYTDAMAIREEVFHQGLFLEKSKSTRTFSHGGKFISVIQMKAWK